MSQATAESEKSTVSPFSHTKALLTEFDLFEMFEISFVPTSIISLGKYYVSTCMLCIFV